MNFLTWAVIGIAASIATIYIYIFISPAYKKGERFSLPILPFFGLIVLHLFVALPAVRYVAFGIDVAMLFWAVIARIAHHDGRKNR